MGTWINRGASGGLAGAWMKEDQNSPATSSPPLIRSR